MPTPKTPADLDATIARDEANEHASMCTPTDWSITGYREAPARAGVAWSGTLNKNGTKVGTVSDGGYGGALNFHWTDAVACRAFTIEARNRYGKDTFEVEDMFAHDLATRAQNNKMRQSRRAARAPQAPAQGGHPFAIDYLPLMEGRDRTPRPDLHELMFTLVKARTQRDSGDSDQP